MSHLEPELLSAYLDDAVEASERAQIERHLPTCATCRSELDALGFVRASARSLERPAIPELHRKQLWREINRTRRAPATRWRALVAVAGTAAAIAAFAGLTMIGQTSGPNVLAKDATIERAGTVTDAEVDGFLAVTAASTIAMEDEGPVTTMAPSEPAESGGVGTDLSEGAPGNGAARTGDEDLSVNHGAQIARCEEVIRPGGDGGAIAVRYILGSYQGEQVYVLVYDIPREEPTHREVFVVSRAECRVLTHRSSV